MSKHRSFTERIVIGPLLRSSLAAFRQAAIWAGVWLVLLLAGVERVTGEDFVWLTRDDGRTRGNPNAPVTLIEYSDFTCGFCVKFFRETWPQIHAQYVATGKVRFMYRDYPRALQGAGVHAAVAARCAGEQDQYWAMHDRLFAGGRLTGEVFERHARASGLDLPVFTKCLKEARSVQDIFGDRAEGVQLGFRGTPGFILVPTRDQDGERPLAFPGAFPFEVFQEQIDLLLQRLEAKRKG